MVLILEHKSVIAVTFLNKHAYHLTRMMGINAPNKGIFKIILSRSLYFTGQAGHLRVLTSVGFL